MVQTVELFSGTKSFSKVAEWRGFEVFTVEVNKNQHSDLCKDVLDIEINDLPKEINVLWSSPPCTAFSVASIGKNWDRETKKPKSEGALHGLKLLKRTVELISIHKPKYWFIENPRGMMRKVIDPIFEEFGITDYKRETVTYCQYGDSRMKPTDIWTNCHLWQPKPPCKNGDSCHESAPRGSRTGTQGIKGAIARGVIPSSVFEEIFECMKERVQ